MVVPQDCGHGKAAPGGLACPDSFRGHCGAPECDFSGAPLLDIAMAYVAFVTVRCHSVSASIARANDRNSFEEAPGHSIAGRKKTGFRVCHLYNGFYTCHGRFSFVCEELDVTH